MYLIPFKTIRMFCDDFDCAS